jgi:ribosomal protein S1
VNVSACLAFSVSQEEAFSAEVEGRTVTSCRDVYRLCSQLEEAWTKLIQLEKDKTFFDVKVTSTNRGGAIVSLSTAAHTFSEPLRSLCAP